MNDPIVSLATQIAMQVMSRRTRQPVNMSVEQAREAGRESARRELRQAQREYPPVPLDDAYQALTLHVQRSGLENFAAHSLLGDAFCDGYDAEIEAYFFER